eukprot:9502072-Pyramimonas_sp.AAC.1
MPNFWACRSQAKPPESMTSWNLETDGDCQKGRASCHTQTLAALATWSLPGELERHHPRLRHVCTSVDT